MINFFALWILINGAVLVMAYGLSHYAHVIFQNKSLFIHEQRLFGFLGLKIKSMSWKNYLHALLKFQILGWLLVYILARFQNPDMKFHPDEAFQLASSFVSNTNWMSLSGEVHWQWPLRLFGIISQNFLSAATGLCVLLVFSRCFKGKDASIGNFYLDFWRANVYLLFPLSILFGLLLVWQGSPQNFYPNISIQQYDDSQALQQRLPMGPIAAQESIKLLGTNGGGYTYANSAHPYENPSFISHCLEMMMMLLLPAMGCFLFARINQRLSYGWYIWLTMFILASIFCFIAYSSETSSMLGKELRIGTEASVMWHAITTASATGASSAIIDQFQPLTYGCYLFLMNIGEIAFGGIGMGVVNLLFLLIVTSFILSLLTGSSPIFLKNRVPITVIKLSMFYIIFVPSVVLIILICMLVFGYLLRGAPHPPAYLLSAAWYAVSSMLNNNGSGFSGYFLPGTLANFISGLLMLLGRFIPIIVAFAVAGIISRQQVMEVKMASFDVDSLLFSFVSLVVILIVTLLAFLPLWSLGPLVSQGLLLFDGLRVTP